MIPLTELWERLLDESGQYLYENLPDTTYDPAKFEPFVKRVLSIYSQYRPIERTFNISVTNLKFDFTDHTYGVPEWISRAVCVSFPYAPLLWNMQKSPVSQPPEMPWTYRKPILYTSANGEFEVTAVYHHSIEQDTAGNYYLPTIDYNDDLFFKLLLGKFLQKLGRSRKAFTLNDLPIASDAADLVSDGRDLEQEALQELGELSKWYLAWG